MPHTCQCLSRPIALICCLLCGLEHAAGTAPATDRPNIVLMMADDMGWGDVGFPVRVGETADGRAVMYGGTEHWRTPNLAAMAEGGLVLSRMYSQAPTCSPTRASVLTGRAPQRIGIPFANRGRLENREVTLTEYAQALGYRTGHFGKWHLGVFSREVQDANRGGKPDSHAHYSTPLDQGYDVEFATESKTSTFDPGTSGLTSATRYWTGPGSFVPLDDARLKGDDSALLAREATAFMASAVEAGERFVAVIWFHTPHKPVNLPGNASVDTLEAYTFAMQGLDQAVGEIRAKLRELGVAENTLVMFTSDNGPEDDQDYNNADQLRANKRELYEGGVRVPGLIEWPGRIKPGTSHTPMVTTDYLPTLLAVWGIEPVDGRPIDGQSMAKTLFEDPGAERDRPMIFKSSNGHQSVIGGANGRYKLISTNNGKGWALYDLLTDFDENDALTTTDTLGTAPQQTRELYQHLLAVYDAWEQSVKHSLSSGITGDYTTRVERSSGVEVMAEPPASLKRGAVQGEKPVIYLERQHATLRSALTAGDHRLAKGTVVHSYLVHYDPDQVGHTVDVEITFDDLVLAVIVDGKTLAGSDGLSFGDPAFDAGKSRGLERVDQWSLAADGRTLRLMLQGAADDIDEVRVLTRSSLNDARR